MLDQLKPGQRIRCTITGTRLRRDQQLTLARLMRQDPDMRRTLKSAQIHRNRTLVVRSRGGRPWPVRRRCAKYALPMEGATWSLAYSPVLAADFRSVSDCLKIENA